MSVEPYVDGLGVDGPFDPLRGRDTVLTGRERGRDLSAEGVDQRASPGRAVVGAEVGVDAPVESLEHQARGDGRVGIAVQDDHVNVAAG